MDIKDSLRKFYDANAEKYYQTRNKHRSDADIFLEEIKNNGKKTVHILEFGCGSGRLLAYLLTLKGITIHYTGVDISKNLLTFAKKQLTNKTAAKHIKATFICDDISHYLKGPKQESFDFVIGVASFQHIPTSKERFFVMKSIYRILQYDGKLIMTNRSFSLRFLRKYQQDFLRSLGKYIISLGKHQWNDLMIPRQDGKTTHKRFYHIYTLTELKKIAALSGFVIKQLGYINKGILSYTWKQSQNSLIIAQKSIFLQNTPN